MTHKHACVLLVVLSLLLTQLGFGIHVAPAQAAPLQQSITTVTFQEGVSGYTGTLDTTIKGGSPNTSYGSQVSLEWDTQETGGNTPEYALLQFTNIFGDGAGQIPLGSTIVSATLRYRTIGSGDPAGVYESLVMWDENTTYNNFGGDPGVQTDEYNPTRVVTATAAANNTYYTITVTASLQRWADGASNYGWIFIPSGNDGVEVHSSEAATADYRPLLTVSYIAPLPLNVAKTGNGSGTVTSNPPGINCGDTCSANFKYNTVVTLTATADPGSTFTGWSGDCSGTGACVVTMSAARSVTATFTRNVYTLTVNVVGGGTVSRNPDQATSNYGDVVTLTATADPGWSFASWSGDVSGSANPITVTMTANRVVTATFTRNVYTLTVNVVGSGTVAQDPSPPYYYGDVVTLTATPAVGWAFSAWSGAVSGSANPITLTITGNAVVTATFTQNEYALTVNIVGSGTVTRDPDRATYPYGTVVTLTATANPGWSFASWSGDVTGSANPITVTMTANRVVTATFIQANAPPFFTSTPVTQAVRGMLYTYEITATDPDLGNGDAITITAPTLPAWLTLTDNGDGTASLFGTPTDAHIGQHLVVLRVTDRSGLYSEQTFTIHVIVRIYLPLVLRNAP